MGFNRRKLEDERRTVAEKEAASRRATDAQVLEDAERLIADAILADDRRRRQDRLLVSVGEMPRMRVEPHSRSLLSILPAKCAIRRAGAPIQDQHRG